MPEPSPRPETRPPGLGDYPPEQLIETRRQQHHVLQMVASAARSFTPAQDGDAHANLSWSHDARSLFSRPLGEAPDGVRVALRLDRALVAVTDPAGNSLAELRLHGRIRTEVAGWIRAQLALQGHNAAHYRLEMPYEIPGHSVANGALYEFDQLAANVEFGRWFDLAGAALDDVRAREDGASEVRCWPHHFDIATLIELDKPAAEGDDGHLDARTETAVDAESARSIGVGMSPGDEAVAEPYFYVTPCPPPPAETALPPLPAGGSWNTEGWTGAILPADRLLSETGATPEASVDSFLRAAISASRELLDS